MNLFTLSGRNLRAQKVRTLATFAGVMLAVASFVALIGLARGVERTLRSSLELRGTDVVVTEAGAIDLMSSIVSADLSDRIARSPGVEAAVPELTRMTSLENGASAIVTAWPEGGFPWSTLDLIAGKLPNAGGQPAAAIGESMAARHGLAIGDRISLFQTDFNVVGIIGSRSVLTRNLVLVTLDDAQRLTYREGQATSINVRLDADASAEEKQQIVQALEESFAAFSVESTEQLASGYTFARIADALSASISLVAFASAVLAIFNTMSMAVNERRGEIAIMSAVGWPRSRIVSCIVIEGVMLTVAAGIFGCLAGVLAARTISVSGSIAGFIDPEISLSLLVQAALISLVIGLIGSLVPALRTVRLSPADILRGK